MPGRGVSQQQNGSKGRAGSNNQSQAGNHPLRGNQWTPNGLPKKPSSSSVNADGTSTPSSSENRANNAEAQSGLANRKRQPSIHNQKGPMGPRPLDPAGKRSFNNITSAYPSNAAAPSSAGHGREQSINSISRFSFASIIPESGTSGQDDRTPSLDLGSDFFAPINFDDFHNNITSTEPEFEQRATPIVPNNARIPEETSAIPRPVSKTGSVRKVSGPNSIGRTGSLKQQRGQAPTNGQKNGNTETPSTGSVLRSRRQSQFPPNAFNNNSNPAPRAPRKSIGPGTFVAPDGSENVPPPRRRPSVGARKSTAEKDANGLSARQGSRQESTSSRNLKAKSLQPARREVSNELLIPSMTPDPTRSSSTNPSKTPGRSGGRTGTPSSSANKRASTMPHHATGLGARTISPTDARRLKRLSMMPHAPPVPLNNLPPTPVTPLMDVHPHRSRSTPQSPALNARKSLTPSSARTTPDPNNKSYGSGQSLSSSTSFNSVVNLVSPLPRLPPGVMSSSRLSTPKPRIDTGKPGNGEEVPPVPAIPKAYESPASEIDQPFFSAHSSSLPQLDTPITASPTVESLADAMAALETPRDGLSSRKSSVISESDLRAKPVHPAGRKGLQPLRLPPINLLPLSTPTAAKIMALDKTISPSDRAITPPSRHASAKTPSTPMTASRINFSSRTYHDDQASAPVNIRASSSHQVFRGDFDHLASAIGSNTNIPFSFDIAGPGPRNISPFISSSLPKSGGDFVNFMQPKYSGEFTRDTQLRPSGPRAPSFSTNPKAEEKLSPSETEPTFSAASIRRKLSKSRRRSTSKTGESTEEDTTKYNTMPPPKLPASATWGNLATVNSPGQKHNYLKSRRKSSASSFNMVPVNGEPHLHPDTSPRLDERPSIDSNRSFNFHPNRSSSLVSPAPSPASPQPPVSNRPVDPRLSKDDMLAEEEMRKLAAKRKDTEAAARELDALRRRARPRERFSPSRILQSGVLNIFERGEVVDYENVYFTGTRTAQKIIGDLDAASSNFGYDDDRGDYNIVKGDHLSYRYEVIDLLGKGSFGQVVRCIDHKTGILVAVKIIRNKKRFHQQALVEVNILKKLREWDPENEHSVVTFDQSFYFRGHLCISTDLLDMNLYEFIKAHDFRGFSLRLIRRFSKQLLSSLILLNGKKVIHCDLKPENVLLAHPMHSEIKVIDFGSSCFENEKVYTYIQSRFYRSPEVILGMSYGMPIDMWSLGCILAELFTGYPIFPGENEQEQLACIMEIFGPPEKHLIEKSSRKKLFFDSMGKPRQIVSSKGRKRRPSTKELRQVLKCDDEAFLDFITKCLRWDPARRLNPHQAMAHEFVTGLKFTPRRTQTNSPSKRLNPPVGTSAIRPLPQLPPSKAGISGSHSPNKAAPKRHSTINGLQPPFASRRVSHISPITSGSNMTRTMTGPRMANGRSDLAAAAAATASLVSSNGARTHIRQN